MYTFRASFYRKWVVEMQMQQIKKGHLNKYFIEIAVSVRFENIYLVHFFESFLYLAQCSVHEPTKKELNQYIFLQYRPHTSLMAYKWLSR